MDIETLDGVLSLAAHVDVGNAISECLACEARSVPHGEPTHQVGCWLGALGHLDSLRSTLQIADETTKEFMHCMGKVDKS